ncbi:MAG: GLPGLI family protein [Bacteroidota bacterium]
MNHSKKSFTVLIGVLISIFIIHSTKAQKFEGIATYMSDRDMGELSISGKQFSKATQDQLQAQLKKQFQKEYELSFNLTESLWKEVESLDSGPAKANANGVSITITSGDASTYKNTSKKSYIESKESFSKRFLISDELKERKWKMTGATKKIGSYVCYEATYENIREKKTFSISDETKKNKTVTDTTLITAWYTPEIPVPQGPDKYWGLPGLILEITDGKLSYLCTKVVLNPEKGIDIKVPDKGKEISPEEYAKLAEEMAEKMMQQFSGGEEGTTVIKMGN